MPYAGRNNIYEATIRRMVRQALDKRNEEFRELHKMDTDELLLQYLRNCARELSHSPHPEEIIGWKLLTERFGSWPQALALAGLSKPTTPNTPSKFKLIIEEEARQKQIYRERKAEKKIASQQKMAAQNKKRKEK